MINEGKNPWEGMPPATKRRIDVGLEYDFFWMTDERGRYGLYLKADTAFDKSAFEMNLKGITIFSGAGNPAGGDLFIILNRQEDWELFLALCSDLTASCSGRKNSEWIPIVHRRLKRWQQFLKQNHQLQLSIEQQMGLFSELSYMLNYVLPVYGIKASLNAWVGPDFDKQDFSLEGLLIEIKSYPSSKGPLIHVSSFHQLDNSIKPLALAVYGLTLTESGSSVQDLADSIKAVIRKDNEDLEDIFIGKLAEYGYFEGMPPESLFRFAVDKIRAFSVSDDFPKLLAKDVSRQIVSVNYVIDLSKCEEFEMADPSPILKTI